MAYFRDVVGIDVSKQNLDLYVLSGQQAERWPTLRLDMAIW